MTTTARPARKPARIDWFYQRNHCESCERARDFLSRHDVPTRLIDDARVTRFDRNAVVDMLREIDRVVATRGPAIRDVSLTDPQNSGDEVTKLLIGPSGNLRAPTLRIGRTLIVGFSQPLYEQHVLRAKQPATGRSPEPKRAKPR